MLTVDVLSSEQALLHTEGIEVIVPTSAGPLGILTGHQPIVAPLVSGTIIIKKSQGKDETVATVGGILEVHDDIVSIMTDTNVLATTIDDVAVKEAELRAANLKRESHDSGTMQAATVAMAQNLLHLKTRGRRKHSGPRL